VLYYFPHIILILLLLPAILPCMMLAYLVLCSLSCAVLKRVL